jgi:hypothetical protein
VYKIVTPYTIILGHFTYSIHALEII